MHKTHSFTQAQTLSIHMLTRTYAHARESQFGIIFFEFFNAGWTHINVLLAIFLAIPVGAMCWNIRKEHEWRFVVGSTGSGDTLGCLTGGNCTAQERMESQIPGVLAQPLYGFVMCACVIAIVFICRIYRHVLTHPGVRTEKLKQS